MSEPDPSRFEVPGKPGTRYVLFDCETTGLDPVRDVILSVGAVAVRDGEILLDDAFEALVRSDRVTSAVFVHGITPAESAGGMDEAEVVRAFREYLGGSVLVGHHVGFDRDIMSRASLRHFDEPVTNPALDTMRVVLALADLGALGDVEIRKFDFDSLCQRFGVPAHDRHTAAGDAFLTAQIFLRLERLAQKHNLDLEPLCEEHKPTQ